MHHDLGSGQRESASLYLEEDFLRIGPSGERRSSFFEVLYWHKTSKLAFVNHSEQTVVSVDRQWLDDFDDAISKFLEGKATKAEVPSKREFRELRKRRESANSRRLTVLPKWKETRFFEGLKAARFDLKRRRKLVSMGWGVDYEALGLSRESYEVLHELGAFYLDLQELSFFSGQTEESGGIIGTSWLEHLVLCQSVPLQIEYFDSGGDVEREIRLVRLPIQEGEGEPAGIPSGYMIRDIRDLL